MPSTNEVQAARHRERYANDPEFRARCLEVNKASRAKHGKKWRATDGAKKRQRYASDAEYRGRVDAKNSAWFRIHPTQRQKISRDSHLRRAYGMTSEEFEQMVADRNGRCDICGVQPERLCVDHDHDTGCVRGLLCRNCNSALGKFQDSAAVLQKAINYLSANG